MPIASERHTTLFLQYLCKTNLNLATKLLFVFACIQYMQLILVCRPL
jgi:hypothetical protein